MKPVRQGSRISDFSASGRAKRTRRPGEPRRGLLARFLSKSFKLMVSALNRRPSNVHPDFDHHKRQAPHNQFEIVSMSLHPASPKSIDDDTLRLIFLTPRSQEATAGFDLSFDDR